MEPIATVTALLLLVLGIPFYSLKFTSVDAQVLPQSASARQVDNVMRAQFPPFHDTPHILLVENATPAALNTIERDVASVKGVAEVQPPQRLPNGDAVTGKINGALDSAIDVQRLGTADLAFDNQ